MAPVAEVDVDPGKDQSSALPRNRRSRQGRSQGSLTGTTASRSLGEMPRSTRPTPSAADPPTSHRVARPTRASPPGARNCSRRRAALTGCVTVPRWVLRFLPGGLVVRVPASLRSRCLATVAQYGCGGTTSSRTRYAIWGGASPPLVETPRRRRSRVRRRGSASGLRLVVAEQQNRLSLPSSQWVIGGRGADNPFDASGVGSRARLGSAGPVYPARLSGLLEPWAGEGR
jgi:hypothetical protein